MHKQLEIITCIILIVLDFLFCIWNNFGVGDDDDQYYLTLIPPHPTLVSLSRQGYFMDTIPNRGFGDSISKNNESFLKILFIC